MAMTPPRIKTGSKMVPATCVQCGHEGKTSLDPQHYMCSGCRYENYSKSCLEKADFYERKAARLRVEAEEHVALALQFRLRNP